MEGNGPLGAYCKIKFFYRIPITRSRTRYCRFWEFARVCARVPARVREWREFANKD